MMLGVNKKRKCNINQYENMEKNYINVRDIKKRLAVEKHSFSQKNSERKAKE